jgi:hypothetical protein
MLNARLAVKISPSILAAWALLGLPAISGCGAPELTFADDQVDAAAPPEQHDAPAAVLPPDAPAVVADAPTVLPDGRVGAPTYLGRDGRITASDPGYGVEDMTHAWDNDPATKWFVSRESVPWTAFEFSNGASHVLTSYTVTSGNDFPMRDPRGWNLEGSNDGLIWTTLDTQTNQIFSARNQGLTYAVVSSTAYRRYRFYATANNGSWDFQVAEIGLYGY